MKNIHFALLFSLAVVGARQFESRRLEVPADTDAWVFKGVVKDLGRNGRISGGWQASDTQFPWAAQMGINLQNGGLRCTGSLIKENWIVSARHCIADTNAVSVQAALGSADSNNFRVRVFSDMFVWMNVNTGEHPDIALFRLVQNLALNSYVNVVRLPSRAQEFSSFNGFTLVATGWGGDGSGGFPRYLPWTYFTVSPDGCYYGPYVMCSRSSYGGSSLQGGDSGGPSVIYENGTPTLVGINVAIAGSIQISTKVADFLSFISDVTGISIRSY